MKKVFCLIGLCALILGSLIGAGILALPISLGLSGMLPSLLVMLVYGGMMYYSAEVLAREATLQKNDSFDYPSLYGQYLGKIGKYVAVVTNMLILYGLLIAYISGGAQVIANLLGYKYTPAWLSLGFALILSFATMFDLSVINKYNTVLVLGLLASFICLIFLCVPHINSAHLSVCEWKYTTIAIPLVVTACHFHNMIPALCADLKWDLSILRKAMVIGMILAIIMNISWVVCGIGCLPRHGDNSIIAAYLGNVPATVPMSNIIKSGTFVCMIAIFSLVAIITSFLGNGIGLQSFINDILFNTYKIKSLLLTRAITFIPPIIVALLWPNIFIKALDIVGGIGIVTLFGILPCIIAIIKKNYSPSFRMVGGVFLVCSVFALLTVIGGMLNKQGCKPDPRDVECNVKHEGEIYEIQNPKNKKIFKGNAVMFPEPVKKEGKRK